MEPVAAELEEVEVEGHRAWMLAADAGAATDAGAGAWAEAVEDGSLRLLPQYDCYVLGCGQRERVVPEAARKRVFAYGRGRYEGAVGVPVLLVDGVVAGMWERRQRGKRIEVRVEPFVPLTAPQRRQLEAEAERIGAFLSAEAALSVGTLSGP